VTAIAVTLTFITALGSALNAGLFFIFSVCIMASLARLAPAEGLRAMQSINRVIINPLFMAAFMGTALLSVAVIVVGVLDWNAPNARVQWGWAIAGGTTYLVTCLFVTMAFNVPLNNAIDRANADSTEGQRVWTRYLDVWTKWNHVRSVGTFASTAFFILALVN
jgi:uncharacterized membrane protein